MFFESFTHTFISTEAAGSCLGELGPVDFSTIALLHGRDPLYEKAVSLFTQTESQCLYIILNCMNDAITQQRYRESSVISKFVLLDYGQELF